MAKYTVDAYYTVARIDLDTGDRHHYHTQFYTQQQARGAAQRDRRELLESTDMPVETSLWEEGVMYDQVESPAWAWVICNHYSLDEVKS